MPLAVFQQGCCFILLTMIDVQPDAVRQSYWARHWACAIDMLELLAAESAYTHAGGRLLRRESVRTSCTKRTTR